MILKNLNAVRIYVFLALGVMSVGCQPDEVGEGNGLSDADVDASFTVFPVEGQPNRFMLRASTNNVLYSQWNIGDGFFKGDMNEEVFLPDAGSYSIAHVAVGRGGKTNTTTQDLEVATSDPKAGNIVQGGKFLIAEDANNWTKSRVSDSGSEWVFGEGKATIFSRAEWSQQSIYQAIQVEKGREYTIDMNVSGGANVETWFEVYAGRSKPVEGEEYKDNLVMGLSTWDGCATSNFSGRLSAVGCVKNKKLDKVTNKITFDESGTIYLVIRSGGHFMAQQGITISNVEMRGAN